MRWPDALSRLANVLGVPFAELNSYYRAMRDARALPVGGRGHAGNDVTLDAAILFVLGFGLGRQASGAPEALERSVKLMHGSLGGPPDLSRALDIYSDRHREKMCGVRSAIEAPSIMDCMKLSIEYLDEIGSVFFVFDQRNPGVVVQWSTAIFSGETRYDEYEAEPSQISHADLRQTRTIGSATLRTIANIAAQVRR